MDHCSNEFISYGAGVQTVTMTLMADKGLISPRPRAAIFANPGRERKKTYAYTEWMKTQVSIPILTVSVGDLAMSITSPRVSRTGTGYIKPAIPAFFKGEGLKVERGRGLRHCTADFKIDPVTRCVNQLRGGRAAQVWIGITTDEAQRMSPAAKDWSTHRWPLIELGMSRTDCENWLTDNGYPIPPRSSCVFCPFHSDDEWLEIKNSDPDEFQEACDLEVQYQAAVRETALSRVPYFHDSCTPLSSVEFRVGHGAKKFNNECKGMCGV